MNKWDYIIETIVNQGYKYHYNDTQGMHELHNDTEVISIYDNAEDHGQAEIINRCGALQTIAQLRGNVKNRNGLGSCGDCWIDYSADDYINDVVNCIADSKTSIYYSDILDFIRQNPESLADAVVEGLYEVGNGTKYDLYKHGQAAEYLTIERELYDNMQDIITYAVLHQLISDGYEVINLDDYEILRDIASDYNNYDTTQDIIDEVYKQLMLTSDRVCKSNCIR